LLELEHGIDKGQLLDKMSAECVNGIVGGRTKYDNVAVGSEPSLR